MVRHCRPKYIICQFSSRIQAQSPHNAEFMAKVKGKLRKVTGRGYITSCDKVESLPYFFPVSKTYSKVDGKKEIDDIRVVYGTTRSWLNEKVRVP